MIAAAAYIAYKEYERQERIKGLHQQGQADGEKEQEEEIGGQSDNIQQYRQRKILRRRKRLQQRRQRQQQETGQKRDGYKIRETKESSWSLLSGITTKPIRETVSVAAPFNRLSFSNVTACGSQNIVVSFEESEKFCHSPKTNDAMRIHETDDAKYNRDSQTIASPTKK